MNLISTIIGIRIFRVDKVTTSVFVTVSRCFSSAHFVSISAPLITGSLSPFPHSVMLNSPVDLFMFYCFTTKSHSHTGCLKISILFYLNKVRIYNTE